MLTACIFWFILKSKMIEKIKINEIVARIANAISPKKIILFGSYAADTANENSDLDLLVVVNESRMPPHLRARAIRKHLWGITDVPKDIVVYTEKELKEWAGVRASFIANVLKIGKVVYKN